MNVASIVVLAAVLLLAALAVRRNLKKGAPCSCGCDGACRSCAECQPKQQANLK